MNIDRFLDRINPRLWLRDWLCKPSRAYIKAAQERERRLQKEAPAARARLSALLQTINEQNAQRQTVVDAPCPLETVPPKSRQTAHSSVR